MLDDETTVVVAVSGGSDSVALLHALRELGETSFCDLKLHVAHLNHLLRGEESDADEEFVCQLARRLDIPFTSERLDVRAAADACGRNLEEVARELRYQFLRRVAAEINADRIATGHTLTDQAETLLMRLIRGAGGEGLSSIHPVVDNLIIRPLLGVRREETLGYCDDVGIQFRIDRSNLERDLLRNRIRQEVLPLLMELNPKAVEAVARAAENLRLDEGYFDDLVSNLTPTVFISERDAKITMSVSTLEQLHPSLRRRVIRSAIRRWRGNVRGVTSVHLAAIETLLRPGKSGRRIELPSNLVIWREFDSIVFTQGSFGVRPSHSELTQDRTVAAGGFLICRRSNLSKHEAESLSGAVLLDDRRLPERLAVRNRKPGDRYVPAHGHRSRKLKTLMMARRIPVTERDAWPIVVSSESDRIVCAPGLPPAAEFAADEKTERYAAILFERS